VASALAGYVQLEPTPQTINKVYAMYDRLTPAVIQEMCRKYFTEKRRTIATLTPPGVPGPPPPDAVEAAPASMVSGSAQASPKLPAGAAPGRAGAGEGARVLRRPAEVPLVSFRVLFDTGAASDPEGKEGLAALTAALLSRGGTRDLAYPDIVQALYPMSASVSAQVDKEMTVFTGTTHADNLDAYTRILTAMILDPGWREEDFRRVKDDAINYLKVNLRGNNDEELGKEALYVAIFGETHPYGHENTGTLESLQKLTLDDVKRFYQERYTQAALTIGVAGGFPEDLPARLRAAFSRLPERGPGAPAIPEAPAVNGQHVRIIQKDTRATAISFGFPIPVVRSHKDWPALWLATSWLGQHRSSNSHLYQRLREVRGLNYGDYAYIEHFPRGMFQFQPDPNLVRTRQIFQVWIRPVEPANAHFALRAGMYELRKLIDNGLSEEEFRMTRDFLRKYAAVMAKTQSTQLGYALDSARYGIGDFVPWVRGKLDELTRDDVNRAIRTHLSWQNVKIVLVTKDAAALREAIVGNAPSPITYNAPKPADVLEEDKVISAFPLAVPADKAIIVDIEDVFRR
jgi:zinc protease